MKRIILTTGGTGGHIFPALAVAGEVRRRFPEAMILFMGGRYGQEADMAANAGLDFVGLPVRGIMRRGGRGLFAALGMGRGLAKALGVIRKTKPELIVGFGGYAAFAGVLAGRMAGVKTAVHEQNSFPGMTNRLLGKIVDRVFLSMPDEGGAFSAKKTILVGNPVREGIVWLYETRGQAGENAEPTSCADRAMAGDEAEEGGCSGRSGATPEGTAALLMREESGEARRTRPPRLLVMGGSLGARALNQALIEVVGKLLEAGLEIWHQTGRGEYERVRSAYRDAGASSVRVEPFIQDMPRAYQWADFVLCRAGGSSLAEITAAGLPSVLVPFPHAAQDHQLHNARFLEKRGGAVILEQDQFCGPGGDPAVLARTLVSLSRDAKRLADMAACSLDAARPYAAEHLVDGLEALLAGEMR